MNTPTIWNLVKETFVSWDEDRAPRLAAALAYYAIFALAPLLIIAIAVAALFFDETQVRQSILTQLGGLIGQNGQLAIEAMIDGARKPETGMIATAIGVVTLLVAAGGLFGQLQDALCSASCKTLSIPSGRCSPSRAGAFGGWCAIAFSRSPWF